MVKRVACLGCGGSVAVTAPEPWCATCVRLVLSDEARGRDNYKYAAFGGQVRRWREAAGLSRADVVERTGGALKYPRLARIELGDVHVGPTVAAYLGPAVDHTAEEMIQMRDSVAVLAASDHDEGWWRLEELRHYDEQDEEFIGTLRWLYEGDVAGGPSIASAFMLDNIGRPEAAETLLPLFREYEASDSSWRPGAREELRAAIKFLNEGETVKTLAFVQGLIAARDLLVQGSTSETKGA